MKKISLILVFILSVSFLFAEQNWSDQIENSAEITIYRPEAFIGMAAKYDVYFHQQKIVQIENGSYTKFNVPEGDNLFYFINDILGSTIADAVLLNMEVDEDCYLCLKVLYGGTIELQKVDSHTAAKDMAGLKEVKINGGAR